MKEPGKSARAVFVSFSGIDGAGKSTQIDALSARLRQDGLRVDMVRFWDDIARLKRIREASGHRIFKGDKGVGSPATPINRRDKNVRSPLMTCVRLFLYSVDALSTRLVVKRALRSNTDLVIFDRYTYDELANLNLRNPLIRIYARLIISMVPRPDVSFVIDADPVQARARKPEYPLEFVRTNRQAYLALANLVGGFAIIPASSICEAEERVLRAARRALAVASGAIEPEQIGSQQVFDEPADLDESRSRPIAS